MCFTLSPAWIPLAGAVEPKANTPKKTIRAGTGRTIVDVRRGSPTPQSARNTAGVPFPYPRPRLAGFSPRVAITTTDEARPPDYEWDHELQTTYVGLPLNPAADPDFVIGYLDSGSDVNLAAGSFADRLGLSGSNLTSSGIPIGGVGGQVNAYVTMPVAFFAAGMSAVNVSGLLNYTALTGHSNVCGLAAPPIDCGWGEVVSAIIGNPFIAFHNFVIRVDTPRTVTVGGETFTGPDIEIQQVWETLPDYTHKISIEFGGLSPIATTANYYPDFLDQTVPIFPTLLSLMPGTIPTGGMFFTTIYVLEGEPGPFNPVQPMRVMVDTGAQSSIMSHGMAAQLSLPLTPDFTVDVCGVGGLVTGIGGYKIDFVKINASNGALEFAEAPFVVLDLPSPEGGTLDGILGMNFFWNRNVIFEPALGGSGFFHVSDPIPVAFADSDVDFDVDVDDAEVFIGCAMGPNDSPVSPECSHLDINKDDDLDLSDFAAFQRCYSGEGFTADPNCN